MPILKLLDNVSVDTVGDAKKGDGGGKVITAYGNFGGGSITMEVSDEDPTNWVPITMNGVAVVITAPIALYLRKVAQPQYIRATLAGSSGAVGVNVVLSN